MRAKRQDNKGWTDLGPANGRGSGQFVTSWQPHERRTVSGTQAEQDNYAQRKDDHADTR